MADGAVTTPADPVGYLLTYGPLGLMVVGFLSGLLVPGWLYKRTEDENDRLRMLIEERAIPMVEDTTRQLERAIEALSRFDPPARRPRPRGTGQR